jgi:hypothetical protein
MSRRPRRNHTPGFKAKVHRSWPLPPRHRLLRRPVSGSDSQRATILGKNLLHFGNWGRTSCKAPRASFERVRSRMPRSTPPTP